MRTTWCWLLLSISAGAGCVSLPGTWGPGVRPASTAKAKAKTRPREVTKDEINEANAHEKAETLREELDRDDVSDNASPADDALQKPGERSGRK
ncbi:MAG TPA: hypothetical protein VG013_04260 [Gemmataceae bacterium]|nr:hypothetical protein [Gemmataceae bacterium]